MTDERHSFIEDVKERKRTAVGAHNRRTHTGKGGAVKFPSDYMTKKEIKKMNGECKSYRLNEPMLYSEFKKMPKDIQKQYILSLISKFDMSGKALSKMFECSESTIVRMMSNFGISRCQRRSDIEFMNKDAAFELWWRGDCILPTSESKVADVSGVTDENESYTVDTDISVESSDDEEHDRTDERDAATDSIDEDPIMPISLKMTLHGSPWQIYKTLESIYGKNKITIDISINYIIDCNCDRYNVLHE